MTEVEEIAGRILALLDRQREILSRMSDTIDAAQKEIEEARKCL